MSTHTSYTSYTSYDGSLLSFRTAGEGPPLICLPGGPGMDVQYLGNLGGLDRRRTLILADQRAAGRSATPSDHSRCAFTEQARDLEALRLHLGQERIDLLAHSAATLTAQEYAAAHPDRIGKLILVTPVGRAAREADSDELAAIRAGRSGEPWYPDAAAAAAELELGGQGPEAQAALMPRTAPFAWGRWTPEARAEYRRPMANAPGWLRQAFYSGAPSPAEAPARLARLAASGARPLVVAGGLDGLIGTAPARLVAQLHPGSRLEVLEQSGHRLWLEEPKRFTGLVLGFLDGP